MEANYMKACAICDRLKQEKEDLIDELEGYGG
jgi:hypothetical protein